MTSLQGSANEPPWQLDRLGESGFVMITLNRGAADVYGGRALVKFPASCVIYSDWTIALEKCRARQTDQAPARERHSQRLSRRNRCRLIYLGRNGARYRVYVKAAI